MDNLAREAKLAKKAGMSYGKWKAMQPRKEKKRKSKGKVCVCKYCGSTFETTNSTKLYCGDECRIAANGKRQSERKKNNENCS